MTRQEIPCAPFMPRLDRGRWRRSQRVGQRCRDDTGERPQNSPSLNGKPWANNATTAATAPANDGGARIQRGPASATSARVP